MRPDAEAEDEQILTSLTRFDFVACLVAVYGGADYYPNFARYRADRTTSLTSQLVHDRELRQALAFDDDSRLAAALVEVDRTAQREGFFYDGWEGYPDDVMRFVAAHLPSADKQA
ncbi:hypothetical protein [Nonomuraea sp. NPDC049695]|uniref:hypothetical protein n=1 Tax=Nonomuraea sp. NPDC049695 TaxID=3154734 RepID=UPI003436A1E0